MTQSPNKHKLPENQNKIQIGFRIDPRLYKEIRKFAAENERNLTWVLTKVIAIGWPQFLKQRAA